MKVLGRLLKFEITTGDGRCASHQFGAGISEDAMTYGIAKMVEQMAEWSNTEAHPNPRINAACEAAGFNPQHIAPFLAIARENTGDAEKACESVVALFAQLNMNRDKLKAVGIRFDQPLPSVLDQIIGMFRPNALKRILGERGFHALPKGAQ